MKPLPLPLRLAAGLVATAVEQARDLPRLVAELPITAVSQTLQASIRVQQKVTELAIKGDRALSLLIPVEEKPSWATFEEEDDELPHRTNGVSTVTELRPRASYETVEELDPIEDAPAAAPETEPAALPDYPTLTIPQLRGRLRFLSVEQLHELLDWELGHDNRPPFVTMLANRITTVTE